MSFILKSSPTKLIFKLGTQNVDYSATLSSYNKMLWMIVISMLLMVAAAAPNEDKEDILDEAEATVNELSKFSNLNKE